MEPTDVVLNVMMGVAVALTISMAVGFLWLSALDDKRK